jgi:hypothetical protein
LAGEIGWRGAIARVLEIWHLDSYMRV